MTNYLHTGRSVEPEEGKKYRVTVVEKHRADAGAIKSWHVYTVKYCLHMTPLGVYDSSKPTEISEVVFVEHPATWYKRIAFNFFPVVESCEEAVK